MRPIPEWVFSENIKKEGSLGANSLSSGPDASCTMDLVKAMLAGSVSAFCVASAMQVRIWIASD